MKRLPIPQFSENVLRSIKIENGEETTPSEKIKDIAYKMEYDYSNTCGAHNCECYDNRRMIEAILIYLDRYITND